MVVKRCAFVVVATSDHQYCTRTFYVLLYYVSYTYTQSPHMEIPRDLIVFYFPIEFHQTSPLRSVKHVQFATSSFPLIISSNLPYSPQLKSQSSTT